MKVNNQPAYQENISLYVPEDVINKARGNTFLKNLCVTKFGYFKRAFNHSMYRDSIHEYILMYCLDGSGWMESGNKLFNVKKGDIVICEKELAHGYGASREDPWTIYWAHFVGEGAPELLSLLGVNAQTPVLSPGILQELLDMMHGMHSVLKAGYTLQHLLRCSTLLQQFFSIVIQEKTNRGLSANKRFDVDSIISTMQNHLYDELSLDELASSVNLSKYHFSRCFKDKTGYSPIEYFNRLKIQRACELLDTSSMSIKEISSRLAYNNPYYFSESFKSYIGYSPAHYRKMQRSLNV